MIRLGNNEVLKTLTKTLTFVDADINADANSEGSTIALREPGSGELKTQNTRQEISQMATSRLLVVFKKQS